MRLNASIAILVIAGLSLLPAPLLAKQARSAVRKSQSPSHKRTHRESTEETAAKTHKRRRKPRTRQVDAPEPVTVHRVRKAVRGQQPDTRIASGEGHENGSSPDAPPARKATSEDFVRAAQGLPPDGMPPAATTGVSHPPDNDEETPRSGAPVKSGASTATRVATEPQIVDDSAAVIQPALYNKRGRLVVPRPLKGSHEILVRQNIVADREGLDRIKDDDDLDDMRAHALLVPLPASAALEVDDRLPGNRRYSRPWTAQFLVGLARAHYARFHTPLQVTSAVRTVEFQQRLQRTNGNAAPAEGETASPHLTGQAVDIAKHGLSLTEIAWLRGYLLALVQQGKIDVEEEFQQSCFHISVYRKYLPGTGMPKREIASGRRSGTAALAAAMP